MATTTRDAHTMRALPDQAHYWGVCPHCRRTDGFLNVQRAHWFVCHEHRLRWCAGANLFSCWRSESGVDWERNWERIGDYRVIELPEAHS